MAEFVVAKKDEIPLGKGKAVFAGEVAIALFNINGTFYAIENTCPHKGGPLGEGDLDEKIVSCPWHGWQFDITTGENVGGTGEIKTFPVKVDEKTGEIKVIVD